MGPSRSPRTLTALLIAVAVGAGVFGASMLLLDARSRSTRGSGVSLEPSPAAAPSEVSTPSARRAPAAPAPNSMSEVGSTERFPGLTITTTFQPYSISGRTSAELRAEMTRKGPSDAAGRHDAYTRWYVSWKLTPRLLDGACEAGPVHVEVQVTYILPRFSPSADTSPEVVEAWSRYRRALRVHEDGHRDHGVEAGRQILRELGALRARATCAELERQANDRGAELIGLFSARDRGYDVETRSGATQGAVFP